MTSERTLKARLAGAGGAAYVLLAVSCGLLDSAGDAAIKPHPLAFDHAVHAETGLECADCHEGEEEGQVALPTLETCLDCHEDEENEETAAFLAGLQARPPEARWILYAASDEVVFAHETHAQTDCDACHGDVTEMAATGPQVRPAMATCTACHAREAPEHNGCADCHRTLREDVPPPSHLDGWRWDHGVLARHGDLDVLLEGDCGYCHKKDTCLDCHRQVQPRSHDHFFRLRGHGLMAGNDRASCETCHTVDGCIRCHETTRPLSHRGGWGQSQNRHCLGCHDGGQAEQGCALCHTQGAPSHAGATPMPPDHNPGMNCRQCHGLSAPLPHVDNGSTCTACHL